ncbi:SDR family NAD(P)-dependent oxidoreductase [Sphingobium sp. EP60837]|uniref:SDR family NAD(P)-dependent oxidoreductase n=1 Tax=Sphingobium sp. EP60837 TaxID=1855519 RepID=UPI0007DDB051|nr:SDR family oxidoreductase [Sphingobium sp. EP60837]ANI79058.1 3-hydroxybutyrate dehydrogenase [Sphingobium sp. EP60837]
MSTAPLAGKTALVTGGSGGIGTACARALAADGARVVIMGRREEALRASRSQIADAVPDAEIAICPGDAGSEEDVGRALEQAHALAGRLDILVPTVGGSGFAPFLSASVADLRRDLDLNITTAFIAMRLGAPLMKAGGSIICISSTAATLPFPALATYCASKAGLEGLIRTVADELGALGIRVNAVRPGLTRSEATADMFADPAVIGRFLEQTPLKRVGEPEDIAAAVAYLAGPGSSWVTGQSFAVDGGQELRRNPDLLGAG